MNQRVGVAWEQISLRAKLTTLSVALIGLLLAVSSLGTVSLLKTYLQSNADNLLISTAEALRDEDPSLIETRLANRELELPPLPSDFYIAYLDTEGQLLIGLVSSTDGKKSVPNLSKFDIASVVASQGIPFDVDSKGKAGNRVMRAE